MPDTRTIDLMVPIEHHNVEIKALQLREPTGALYAQLGEPRIIVRTGAGGYWVEQPDVIKRYLDRVIDHQDGVILLGLMSMPDVMRLKEELFGFFADAEARITAARAASSSSASKP